MSERRSGRSRKVIDYAKFETGTGGGDDDDDFQCSKSQPEKRPKASEEKSEKRKKKKLADNKKEKSSSQSPVSSQSFEHEKPNKSRLSVDDKIFERQLRVVLERSICEATVTSNENSQDVEDHNETNDDDDDNKHEKINDDDDKHEGETKICSGEARNITGTPSAAIKHPIIDDVKPPKLKIETTSGSPPQRNTKRSQPSVSVKNTNKGPDLSLISPVKNSSPSLLSSKGLRIGLSRKVSIKPLHPEVKMVS